MQFTTSLALVGLAAVASAQSANTGASTLIAVTSGAPYAYPNGTGPYVGATGVVPGAAPGTAPGTIVSTRTATATAPGTGSASTTSSSGAGGAGGAGAAGSAGSTGAAGAAGSASSTGGAPMMTAGVGLAALAGGAAALFL